MIKFRKLLTLFVIGAQVVCSQLWDDEDDEMSVVINNRSAITNGYDSPDRPFYVRVLIKDKNSNRTAKCGGSIISPQLVLSAAHCFYNGMYYFLKNLTNTVLPPPLLVVPPPFLIIAETAENPQ